MYSSSRRPTPHTNGVTSSIRYQRPFRSSGKEQKWKSSLRKLPRNYISCERVCYLEVYKSIPRRSSDHCSMPMVISSYHITDRLRSIWYHHQKIHTIPKMRSRSWAWRRSGTRQDETDGTYSLLVKNTLIVFRGTVGRHSELMQRLTRWPGNIMQLLCVTSLPRALWSGMKCWIALIFAYIHVRDYISAIATWPIRRKESTVYSRA